MRWVHLIFGLILFIVFTQTGSFMRVDFPDKDVIPQEFRMLMRSRHIYILFSALIHIVLGIYLRRPIEKGREVVQYIASTILILSSVLLVVAFFTETYYDRSFSDISRYGIYASLVGVVLHMIGGLTWQRPDR